MVKLLKNLSVGDLKKQQPCFHNFQAVLGHFLKIYFICHHSPLPNIFGGGVVTLQWINPCFIRYHCFTVIGNYVLIEVNFD